MKGNVLTTSVFDIRPQYSAVLTSTSKLSHRHLYSLYTVLLWCTVSLLITSITDVFILDQIKCSVAHRDILPHAHCTCRTETTLYDSEQLFPNIKATFCRWYFLQLGALTFAEGIIFWWRRYFLFFPLMSTGCFASTLSDLQTSLMERRADYWKHRASFLLVCSALP